MFLIPFFFLSITPSLLADGPATAIPEQEKTLELVKKDLLLADAEIRDLSFPENQWSAFSKSLRLGEENITLNLSPVSLRSWDFKLLVQDETGELIEKEAPAPTTYRGNVDNYPDSVVAASIIDGRMTAMIALTTDQLWLVQPLSDVDPEADPRSHVVYRSADIVAGEEEWTCGVEDEKLMRVGEDCFCANTTGGTMTMGLTGISICDIALDADYDYFKKNGYSVTNTMLDLEKIVNGMNIIYERDTGITYELTTIIVRTAEPDPYSSTNAGTLLTQFTNEWNANCKQIKRDTAHLVTGKNLNGSTIGVAYLAVICNKQSAYGLTELKFSSNFNNRVTLICHEVGHNWNAGHCDAYSDCHIMCSGLGGCAGIGLPNFGNVASNQIKNYKSTRTCLIDQSDPLTIPFSETWTSTTHDWANWSYKNGTTIETIALNEPSPPYSLRIDASGSVDYAEDEIRSNFILLSGQNGAQLSYYTQHRGVENGEKLIVEFRTMAFTWQVINTITSNGVDQTTFTKHVHTLPFLALHDEFRVRFRAEVSDQGDNWFVDDVYVGHPMPDPPELFAIEPKAGKIGGGDLVTLTGDNFTSNPAMTVTIGGVICTNVTYVNATTLTCNTGAGTLGFQDVSVSSSNGNDTLSQAFRYFPVSVDPYNVTDVDTSSLDTPANISLIISGYPSKGYGLYFSLTGGPLPSVYGTMGMGIPFYFLFSSVLNSEGYSVVPVVINSGMGPLDLYVQCLGYDSSNNLKWGVGGNNPSGSTSIWLHLNN